MARIAGSPDIKGWQEHCLLRDLALGEESPEELADKYSMAVQSVYDYRWRNKHRIAAVLAEWSNEFSDLWSVKKHARIADLQALADGLQQRIDELYEDAERETGVMRRVHPDAVPVRVSVRDLRGLTRDKAKIEAQIERSLGQDPQTIAAVAGKNAYPWSVMRQLGLVRGRNAAEATVVGPVRQSAEAERVVEPPPLRLSTEDAAAVWDARVQSILDRVVPLPVDEPAPAPVLEPVEAPVQAPELAPALAPVVAEEPAPEPAEEPAPELVEPEPELIPRMTSIKDFRGSIVLQPEYSSRSMAWGPM